MRSSNRAPARRSEPNISVHSSKGEIVVIRTLLLTGLERRVGGKRGGATTLGPSVVLFCQTLTAYRCCCQVSA